MPLCFVHGDSVQSRSLRSRSAHTNLPFHSAHVTQVTYVCHLFPYFALLFMRRSSHGVCHRSHTRQGTVPGLVRRSRRHFDPGQRALGVRPRPPQNPPHHCFCCFPSGCFRDEPPSNASSPRGSTSTPPVFPIGSKFLIFSSGKKPAGRRIALATAADRELAETDCQLSRLLRRSPCQRRTTESQGSEQSCVSSPALRRNRLRICGRLCRRCGGLA